MSILSGICRYGKYAMLAEAEAERRYGHLKSPAEKNLKYNQHKNAFVHAFVAAKMTQDCGASIVRVLGELRELYGVLQYYFGLGEDYRMDTFRDLWNNVAGEIIGGIASAEKLSDSQVADCVAAALDAGDLILSIHVSNRDLRIPKKVGDPTPGDFGPGRDPSNFNGFPGDFYPYIGSIEVTAKREDGPDEPDDEEEEPSPDRPLPPNPSPPDDGPRENEPPDSGQPSGGSPRSQPGIPPNHCDDDGPPPTPGGKPSSGKPPGNDPPNDPPGDNPCFPPPQPTLPRDPLVIDLDGDGIELIALEDSQAHFDFGEDGFAEKTGWVAPDDGLLFRDKDGNGVASGIGELFGNLEIDGFTELAELDSNGDGVIDAKDDAFAQLWIWRDLNGDGISTADEVSSLADHNIVSFGLQRREVRRENNGNEIRYSGLVERSDGTHVLSGAVYFAQNSTLTRWTPPDGMVISDEVAKLPSVHGYGNLTNLDYAMQQNAALRQKMQAFVRDVVTMSPSQIEDAFSAILFAWAGVGNVAADSRGASVDAREVAFLEAFFGTELRDRGGVTIGTRFGEVLNGSFDQLLSALMLRVLSNSFLSKLLQGGSVLEAVSTSLFWFAGLRYDSGSDRFWGDMNSVLADIVAHVPDDVSQARDYLNVMITVLRGAIYDFAGGDPRVLRTMLADAFRAIENEEIRDYALQLANADHLALGTTGNDTITTLNNDSGAETISGADLIIGGHGNDTLSGGDGRDVYLFTRGDGQDTIEDNGDGDADEIVISGYTPAQIQVARATPGTGMTLVITFTGSTTDRITVINTLDEDRADGIEKIRIKGTGDAADTVWTMAQLRARILASETTDGADTINGFFSNDRLVGGLGNDTLRGLGGHDTLAGGEGNDTLSGGYGSDRYVFHRGDGQDTIEDNGWRDTDEIVIHGYTADQIQVARGTGATLIITFVGSTDRITVINTLDERGDDGIERIRIVSADDDVDDTVWTMANMRARIFAAEATDGDDTIIGFATHDTLAGGEGNDTLSGGRGSDRYVFHRGDGQDTIEDNGWRDTDEIVIHGYTADQIQVARGTGATLIITFVGSTDRITVINTLDERGDDGIERIRIVSADDDVDDTVWTMADMRQRVLDSAATDGNDTIEGFAWNDTIDGGAGDDTINGGAGNDTINGGSGNDTLSGGPGNDTINGGAGNDHINGGAGADTINGGAGDDIIIGGFGSDTMDGGAGIDTVSFAYSSADWNINLENNTAQAPGYNAEKILNFENAIGSQGNDRITGTSDDNILDGGAGNDTINGGAGNDTINGGAGVDTINGGAGDDIIIGGFGSDTMDGGAGIDTVSFAYSTQSWFIDLENGTSSTQAGSNNPEQILNFENAIGSQGNDRITGTSDDNILDGGAGNDTINGGAGNDTISGGLGNDTLDGGAGNDTLSGGVGEDTFVFEPNFDVDTINDFDADDDIIQFSTSVFATYQDVQAAMAEVGDDVVITLDADNTITLKDTRIADLAADDFRFVA